MRNMLNIAIIDLRVFLRDRGNLIGLLAIPLVMTFIIGYVTGGGAEPTRVAVDVLDQDGSDLSAAFIDGLRQANTSLVLCPMDNTEDDFCKLGDTTDFTRAWSEGRVKDGTTHALIEIPAGFADSVRSFQPVSIGYLSQPSGGTPDYVQQAVDAAVLRINGAVVASRVGTNVAGDVNGVTLDASAQATFAQNVYQRAATMWAADPIQVNYEQTAQPDTSNQQSGLQAGMGQSVPGMGTMFVMFTVFGGMAALIMERKQGTLQRLAVMPVSRTELLGGKIIGRFLLGIVQMAVIFAVAIVLRVNLGNDILALLLLIISYTLTITALSFALGSTLKTDEQASSFGLLLTMILAPLGGAWWPLEIVPETMRTIGHISPVAWAMDGFSRLIFNNGTLVDVLPQVGVLLVMALVFFVIAVRRFRYD